MKFEYGDKVYKGLVETAGHEFLVATESYNEFKKSSENLKNNPENKLLNAICYQHYADL